jgi:hypothetical protein
MSQIATQEHRLGLYEATGKKSAFYNLRRGPFIRKKISFQEGCMGAPPFALDFWMQKSASFFVVFPSPCTAHPDASAGGSGQKIREKKTKIYIRAF